VDLPAPFSPIRPWISPGRMPIDIFFNATTPGKRLVMFFSSTTYSLMGLPRFCFLISAVPAGGREVRNGNMAAEDLPPYSVHSDFRSETHRQDQPCMAARLSRYSW